MPDDFTPQWSRFGAAVFGLVESAGKAFAWRGWGLPSAVTLVQASPVRPVLGTTVSQVDQRRALDLHRPRSAAATATLCA